MVVTSGETVTCVSPMPVAVKLRPGTPRTSLLRTLLLLWRTVELPPTVKRVDLPAVSELSAVVRRSAEARLLVPSAMVMLCGPRWLELSTSWSS